MILNGCSLIAMLAMPGKETHIKCFKRLSFTISALTSSLTVKCIILINPSLAVGVVVGMRSRIIDGETNKTRRHLSVKFLIPGVSQIFFCGTPRIGNL